jgi:hypothetical protein
MKGKDRGNIEVYKRNGYTVTLTHDTQQLFLKNELALLVFLTALICFVVLPSYCFLALSAVDVAHDMFSRCHVTFDGIGLSDVHNIIEEVGFAMLAAEILEVWGQRVLGRQRDSITLKEEGGKHTRLIMSL